MDQMCLLFSGGEIRAVLLARSRQRVVLGVSFSLFFSPVSHFILSDCLNESQRLNAVSNGVKTWGASSWGPAQIIQVQLLNRIPHAVVLEFVFQTERWSWFAKAPRLNRTRDIVIGSGFTFGNMTSETVTKGLLVNITIDHLTTAYRQCTSRTKTSRLVILSHVLKLLKKLGWNNPALVNLECCKSEMK